MTSIHDRFAIDGILGPVPVFSGAECRALLVRLAAPHQPSPADWQKGNAVSNRLFLDLATRDSLLDLVGELVGEDVMLWGASVVRRRPGQKHVWHTDIETSDPTARSATVWIGLENVDSRSTIRLVPGSHRFGVTIQQAAAERGQAREDEAVVRELAHERDPNSSLLTPELTNGDAVVFDGRIWHGSCNTRNVRRTALLLQYACPETLIRIPDFKVLDWPFRFLAAPRPACVMVRGSDHSAVNRIVPAPPRTRRRPMISTWIEPLRLPLEQDEARGWKPHPIFRGPTSNLDDLSCHVSVLDPGKTPHPPHTHAEEEILIIVDGQAELLWVDADGRETVHPVRTGHFAYYPAGQLHTLRGAGNEPVTYLMFKWTGDGSTGSNELQTAIHEIGKAEPDSDGRGFKTRVIFEGQTRFLRRLHTHASTLLPGAGYAAHIDAHDVAFLVLDGTVETLGRRVERHGIVFYAGGEPHGLRNVGEKPAHYLVVEFHKVESDLKLRRSRRGKLGRRIIGKALWLAARTFRKRR